MILEACISTISGLKAAQKYGIQRIEICKDLHLEGLTPTDDFQSIANDIFNGESYVMIRPHNNGFEYTKNELELMMDSIKIAKNNQAHGVVFGILQNDKVDLKKNEELVKLAKDLDLKCTFHKAFDECKNINQSLIELSEIGFDWVLTSGKEKNAELGLQNLKILSEIKNRKIKILAGGGISGLNYHKFLNLGLDGIHFSIDKNNEIEVEKITSIKNGLKLY